MSTPKNIVAERQAVAERFESAVAADLEGFIRLYRSRFGSVLSADLARELSPDYSRSKESRALFGSAVHSTAGTLVWRVYERMIEELGASPEPIKEAVIVLMLGGGGGSGKSTLVEETMREFAESAAVIYDTTLSHYEYSKQRIEMALAAGATVDVLYVHRPVDLAVRGAVRRAVDADGRCVPLDRLAADHFHAQRTFVQLLYDYEDDLRVRFTLADNSGERGTAHEVPLESIFDYEYASEEDAQIIAREAFDDEYQDRRGTERAVPDYIYEAFIGEALPQR